MPRTDGCRAWRCIAGEYRVHPLAVQDGVLLDEQNCLMLHELWLQSGTGQRRWEGLPDDVRDTITALFTAKRGDWCGFWSNEDVSVWWNRLCDNVLPEKPCRLTC